jgi:hypothetical protein
LIHGSTEGRFSVTYCPLGLSRREIESAGYSYAPFGEALGLYDPAALREGWNNLGSGERICFIRNPAIGLWSDMREF